MRKQEISKIIAKAYAAAWKHDIETHLPSPASAPSWDEIGSGQRAAMIRVSDAVVSAMQEAGWELVQLNVSAAAESEQ